MRCFLSHAPFLATFSPQTLINNSLISECDSEEFVVLLMMGFSFLSNTESFDPSVSSLRSRIFSSFDSDSHPASIFIEAYKIILTENHLCKKSYDDG